MGGPRRRDVVFPDAVAEGIGDDLRMVCYVVERHLVGWTSDEVDALLSRLDEATEAMADEGVRYLGSVVLPTDEICLGLFTGADAAAVTAANVARGMPVERVLLARTATLGGAAA